MSYCELLTQAMKIPRAAGPSDGLLEALLNSRSDRALDKCGPRPDLSECLAHEVAYDRALIDISDAMGIETSPVHFASPVGERRRLEQVLAERGSNWNRFIYPDRGDVSQGDPSPAA